MQGNSMYFKLYDWLCTVSLDDVAFQNAFTVHCHCVKLMSYVQGFSVSWDAGKRPKSSQCFTLDANHGSGPFISAAANPNKHF